MSKTTFTVLAIGVLAAVYALTLLVQGPRIEQDLSARTRAALEQRAFSVTALRFSGRDGELEVHDSGDRAPADEAQRVAQGVFGVRVARVITQSKANNVGVEQGDVPLTWHVKRVGETLRLSGRLPQGDWARYFEQAAGKVFEGFEINSEFEQAAAVHDPGYLLALAPMVKLLARTAPRGELALSENQLRFSGEVVDPETRALLKKELEDSAPQGIETIVDLSVAQQPTQSSEPFAPDVRKEIEKTILHFEFDSTELVSRSGYQLEPLVEYLQQNARVCLRITGHADGTGTDAYNLALSPRRASAIADALAEQGISRDCLKTDWRGKREPMASNRTAKGRALNRRVVFKCLE